MDAEANPGKPDGELPAMEQLRSPHPSREAGLLLERDGDFAIVPWLEALHLACRGWLLHPLDHLPIGHNVDILLLHHLVKELPECPPVFGLLEPQGVEV